MKLWCKVYFDIKQTVCLKTVTHLIKKPQIFENQLAFIILNQSTQSEWNIYDKTIKYLILLSSSNTCNFYAVCQVNPLELKMMGTRGCFIIARNQVQ